MVATLIFGAIAFERFHYWADAEDILAVIKPQLAAEWLSLMIIIDMILYRNLNNLFKGVNYLFILYVLMTFGMIWRRHDRIDPIVLIFPMFLFALVKMNEEKTSWFMRRFIDAWFISFVYVVIRSFIENPYNGFRYYGYFLNIGYFGVYMVCCLTVAIASLIYSKQIYSRKSFPYLISFIWVVFVSYMLWIIDTRTIIVGVMTCLMFIFAFVRKNTEKKKLIHRAIIIICSLITLGVVFVVLMKVCVNVSDDWIIDNYRGPLSPLVHAAMYFRGAGRIDDELNFSQRLFAIIDTFTSSRLSIIKAYSEYFNYDGNGSIGVLIDKSSDYWAYNAHNTYVQICVEYGFLSFFETIAVLLIAIIKNVTNYLRKGKTIIHLLPLLWFASMIGVWFGEASTFFYPATFCGLIFIARIMATNNENVPSSTN